MSPSMMKTIASLGSFAALLAFFSLIVMSQTAYTRDILEEKIGVQPNDQHEAIIGEPTKSQSINSTSKAIAGNSASRERSGRMLSTSQSAPADSYAAAYAAVNSIGAADQTSNHHLAQQTVGDANTYSSFGETSPAQTSISAASPGRQLPASAEYVPNSSYFANYMSPSSNEASYTAGQPSSIGAHSYGNNHHHYYKSSPASLPYGYPTNIYHDRYPISGHHDRVGYHSPAASTPFFSSSSPHSGGLMSSATNALSHWTNGFSIGEIICGLVAISIAAVILGAPFFLIYLALMGNFSGSGTLSLTNPTSTAAAGAATAPNGRRKRLAVFEAISSIGEEQVHQYPELQALADSAFRQMSPYVDLDQLSRTLKGLVRSMQKYSPKSLNRQGQTAENKTTTA